MVKFIATICCLFACAGIAAALDVSSPMLIEGVALTDDAVVFSYAGDLWSVSRAGGDATRLTDTDVEETYPIASPDGRRIAYTSDQGGDANVWVLENGVANQWTFHPKYDRAIGWTPDGARVLFRTGRYGDGVQRLCVVGANDPLPEMLPLPKGHKGAFAPDGHRLVYAPVGWSQEDQHYRYYRGGMTSPMWIVDVRDGAVDIVFGNDANHTNFVWSGDVVYYTCDESGSYNICAYDTNTSEATALTQFNDYGVDAIAVRESTIAYVRMGVIHLLDTATGDTRPMVIHVALDAPERNAREEELDRRITDAHVSDDGNIIVLTARGDVFLHRHGDAKAENITQTSGVAERGAAASPDGKRVAYFSDVSGEYQLVFRDTRGKQDAVFIDIEESPTFYRQLVWSPDGRYVAFTGRRLDLWLADADAGRVTKVDTSDYLAQDLFQPSWSPDSRYIAYEFGKPNHQHDVAVYDVESGQRRALTSQVDATRPVFDRNGKYLYYLASDIAPMAAANNVWGLLSAIQAGPLVTRAVHAVVLQSDQPAPYLPGITRVNEAAAMDKSVKDFRIDWDGIEQRIVELPVPERDFTELVAGGNGEVYLTARNWSEAPGGGGPSEVAYRVIFSDRPSLEDELPRAQQFQSIDGGSRVFMRRGSSVYLQADAESYPEKVEVGDLKTTIDPVAEWAQMYHEAWRMMRDYFYDPGHHGQDLARLEQDYAALLPSITRRADLNGLFIKMLGHISISHMSIGGGDTESARSRDLRVGLLGADLAVDNNAFRIETLYRRSPAYGPNGLALAAPLDQPGIDVREGDYLIAVNGAKLDPGQNLYRQLAGTANKETTVEISANADGANAREYTIVPLSGTNGLRRANWDQEKAETVDRLSGGTIGFVSISQFGREEINGFIRQVVAASDKAGLVIDQRDNGGGITSDALIHLLIAPPLHAYDYPYGADFMVSPVRHTGPKVLIVNEMNFSAAETFPLMFDIADVGTIVGKRTGGGGTGGALHYPDLIDGGWITIPNRAGYNPRTGEWAENSGVAPDVEVEWMPKDFMEGRDPQLERAVAVAMERAKTEPRYEPKRPAFVKHP